MLSQSNPEKSLDKILTEAESAYFSAFARDRTESKGEGSKLPHEKAAELFRRALQLDRNNLIALDWIAFLYKKHNIKPDPIDFEDNIIPEGLPPILRLHVRILEISDLNKEQAFEAYQVNIRRESQIKLAECQTEKRKQKIKEKYLEFCSIGQIIVDREQAGRNLEHSFEEPQQANDFSSWVHEELPSPLNSEKLKPVMKITPLASDSIIDMFMGPGELKRYNVTLTDKQLDALMGEGSFDLLLTDKDIIIRMAVALGVSDFEEKINLNDRAANVLVNSSARQIARFIAFDKTPDIAKRLLLLLEQDAISKSTINQLRILKTLPAKTMPSYGKSVQERIENTYVVMQFLLRSTSEPAVFHRDHFERLTITQRALCFEDLGFFRHLLNALPLKGFKEFLNFLLPRHTTLILEPKHHLINLWLGRNEISRPEAAKEGKFPSYVESLEEFNTKAPQKAAALVAKLPVELLRHYLLHDTDVFFENQTASESFAALRVLDKSAINELLNDEDFCLSRASFKIIVDHLLTKAGWSSTALSVCIFTYLLGNYKKQLVDVISEYWLAGNEVPPYALLIMKKALERKEIPIEGTGLDATSLIMEMAYSAPTSPSTQDNIAASREEKVESIKTSTNREIRLDDKSLPSTIFNEGISWHSLRLLKKNNMTTKLGASLEFLENFGRINSGVKGNYADFIKLVQGSTTLNKVYNSMHLRYILQILEIKMKSKLLTSQTLTELNCYKLKSFKDTESKSDLTLLDLTKIKDIVKNAEEQENEILRTDSEATNKIIQIQSLWVQTETKIYPILNSTVTPQQSRPDNSNRDKPRQRPDIMPIQKQLDTSSTEMPIQRKRAMSF